MNFATRFKRNKHIFCHFNQKNCTKCDISLIQIGDNWYELKLHVAERCKNREFQDHDKENVKIEPSELCQVTHFEPADGGYIDDRQNGSISPECNIPFEQIFECEEKGVKTEVETESLFLPAFGATDSIQYDSLSGTDGNSKQNENISSSNCVTCKICKNSFADPSALDAHSNECLYTCDYCGNKYKHRRSIVQHMQKAHKPSSSTCERKKGYNCEVCNKTYESYYSFHYHRGTHKGTVACSICKKGFQHESLLQAHMKTHSGNKRERKKFKCDICDKMLHKRCDLINHVEVAHEGKTYKCDVCNKGLGSEQSLRNHIKIIHEKETMFKCEICGKNFANGGNLKTHMHTHSVSRPFICSYCGKGFNQNNHLLEHMNTHTGAKPNVCNVCNKGFTRLAQLRAHTRVHTGEKPYKCQIGDCARAYAYIIDLKRHRYSVHGIYSKQHVCPICSKIYPENKLLRKHLESHSAMQVHNTAT